MTLEVAPDLPEEMPDEPAYSAWYIPDTFVVSGPLPYMARKYPNMPGRVMYRKQARCWVAQTYGRFEEIKHPRRWAFRVIKPTAPGGRYTPPKEDNGHVANEHAAQRSDTANAA